MCRSAGFTFTWWSPASDICHYASEVCRNFVVVCICFSDTASVDRDPSSDRRPTHTADRRTEVHIVQYARSSGVAHPGERRASEGDLRAVQTWVASATVDANITQPVYDDTNGVGPPRHATNFAAGHGNDDLRVFYQCRPDCSPGSLYSSRQKSAIKSVRCYTRSCPAR